MRGIIVFFCFGDGEALQVLYKKCLAGWVISFNDFSHCLLVGHRPSSVVQVQCCRTGMGCVFEDLCMLVEWRVAQYLGLFLWLHGVLYVLSPPSSSLRLLWLQLV